MGFESRLYVGESNTVGGVRTYVIAYANDHAFVQAWIGVMIACRAVWCRLSQRDPLLQLRHQMDITDWKLGEPKSRRCLCATRGGKEGTADSL